MTDLIAGPQGSSKRPLVFAGHSHMVALTGNAYCEVPTLRALPDRENTFALDGAFPRNDAYWQAVVDYSENADIALVWGGNEHNICYFFQSDNAFDFVSRQVNKLIPAVQLVPKSMIRRRFMNISLNELSKLLRQIAARSTGRVALVGTPPPKKDNDALRRLMHSEPFFVQQASYLQQSIETIMITAPHVRLKLWHVLQDLLADQTREISGKFVPVPPETQEEEGFLRPDFWAQDITHANDLYGRIMYKSVLEAFV